MSKSILIIMLLSVGVIVSASDKELVLSSFERVAGIYPQESEEFTKLVDLNAKAIILSGRGKSSLDFKRKIKAVKNQIVLIIRNRKSLDVCNMNESGRYEENMEAFGEAAILYSVLLSNLKFKKDLPFYQGNPETAEASVYEGSAPQILRLLNTIVL
jgi:hypothetical protein